ncbi:MAG: HNH endonuclease [Lachnospiraceae bacterium]|nr:HNH endonuclease [Lachnospiraceae bacterium]
MQKKVNRRADHEGPQRTAFEKNRKRILARDSVCAICGRPVDKSLPQHDPMAPQIDHIIPISKGGHPSDIDNLCLVHACCNKAKSDKVYLSDKENKAVSNQNLPWSVDWFAVGK